MALKVAINGFGRIGRTTTRVWLKHHTDQLNLVAINTSGSLPVGGWAHLLKYDSNYGPLKNDISATDTEIVVDGESKVCKLKE